MTESDATERLSLSLFNSINSPILQMEPGEVECLAQGHRVLNEEPGLESKTSDCRSYKRLPLSRGGTKARASGECHRMLGFSRNYFPGQNLLPACQAAGQSELPSAGVFKQRPSRSQGSCLRSLPDRSPGSPGNVPVALPSRGGFHPGLSWVVGWNGVVCVPAGVQVCVGG